MYESSESIPWRSLVFRTECDSDVEHDPELEKELRDLCAWLSPDLARDVVFWLDVGLPPRTVERELCGELMSDLGGAFLMQAGDAEPPNPQSPGPAGPSPVSPTEKRRRSRFFRRRTSRLD